LCSIVPDLTRHGYHTKQKYAQRAITTSDPPTQRPPTIPQDAKVRRLVHDPTRRLTRLALLLHHCSSRTRPGPYQTTTDPYQTSTAPLGPYQTPTRPLADPYQAYTSHPGPYQTPNQTHTRPPLLPGTLPGPHPTTPRQLPDIHCSSGPHQTLTRHLADPYQTLPDPQTITRPCQKTLTRPLLDKVEHK
jgi:hypothetical protein